MQEQLLMIPGPCALDPEVLKEMSRPLVPHYGEDWAKLYNSVREALKPLLGTKQEVFMTVGSGHSAVETAVNGLAGAGEKILVVENGIFGHKIAWIAKTLGIDPVVVQEDWGKSADPGKVEAALQEHGDVVAVAMVHGETSTGVVNPVAAVGRIAKKHGLPFFVDAVCSVGAMEFKMDEWGVDVVVTASQKGLSAPPGLAILCLSEKGWARVRREAHRPVGWYLNLNIWREYNDTQRDYQPYGITMTVNNVRALKASLHQIYQEGFERRFARHREVMAYLREGLKSLGLEPWATGEPLPLVTAVKCPPGIATKQIVDNLINEYGIWIGSGLGEYKNSVFRIGHMGRSANQEAVDRLLAALRGTLEKLR
ncbi:MAG: pyridoxal-phosphate-dependent aminotransferase family protein [Bacillota bacterium]